jgi:hypothetical protein
MKHMVNIAFPFLRHLGKNVMFHKYLPMIINRLVSLAQRNGKYLPYFLLYEISDLIHWP